MNTIQLIRAAMLCLVPFAFSMHASAAELTLPRDGWASWQVPAVDDAPDWCCFSHWKDRNATHQPCRLERKDGNFGGRDGETTDSIRVYARIAGGKIDRLRALSATCPVQADTAIQDLGAVSVDDSARWLAALVKGREADTGARHRVADEALAALAIHRGDIAHDALVDIARRGARDDNREQAVFWLAHLRGREGAKIATSIMFDDPDADIREHAAFAVSQSISPTADKDLIRLANTDPEAQVRSHAWFSLSQTESSATEGAIDAALRKETDRGVREQAIFALSQLPDERATRALIKVAEDKSLAREERKRAVFWLSQSESSAAQAYLQEVLAKVTD
jgi:HEAT repeat protein